MFRSFSDRVFGGVCGGLGQGLRFSPWLLRVAFIVLAAWSGGAFAALYLLLWWTMPQETPTGRRRGGLPAFIVLLLIIGAGLLWLGRDLGWLNAPTGESLYLPALLLVVSVVFFLRQVRA